MEKQHIINEIKRTAEANGGVALGVRRFQTETGIRQRDWLGRYWAKWSDAVSEAGYEPNEKSQGYTDDHLLRVFVEYIEEIRRFPTDAEFRLHSTQTPHFPSEKVFRRFGGKAQLLKSLISWCEQHPVNGEVLAICRSAAQDTPPSSASPASPEQADLGYVYLIKSGRHYKIGRTNALGRREYELAIQLPEKSNAVHVIATDDPVGIEAYWHNRFSEKRKNGEWFELSSADVSAFRRRKFM